MSRREQSFVSKWTQAFRDSHLPQPTARAVGYALATFANADGTSIRPGTVRLMVATSLSRNSVLKGINVLIDAEWLDVVCEGTPRRASEYRLTLPPDVIRQVAAGQRMVAQHRDARRENDAQWAAKRRDRHQQDLDRGHGWDTP